MFEAIARTITRWPKIIISVAFVAVVASAIYSSGVFAKLAEDNGFNNKDAESSQVTQQLQDTFGIKANSGIILFKSKADASQVQSLAYEAEMTRLLSPLKAEGAHIDTYYSTLQPAFISTDGHETYAVVTLPGSTDKQYRQLKDFASTVHGTLLQTYVGGELVGQKQAGNQVENDLKLAETISLPILAVLLLIIFRSVIAAALPLILGVTAIVGGISVVRLLTRFTSIDQYSLNIITVLGLGLSVDYSLLMVNRFREELDREKTVEQAIRRTVLTAGRTIFFSGLTVIMCLLSLIIFPIGFLRSIGIGGTSAIVVAVVGALVILPAILRLLGDRVNRLRIITIRTRTSGTSIWHRIGAFTMKHPLQTLILSGALVLVIASPVLQAHFMAGDYRTLPTGSSSQEVGRALAHDFATQQAKLTVIYHMDDAPRSAAGITHMYALTQSLAAIKNVTDVTGPTPLTAGASALSYQQAYASGSPPPPLQQLAAQTIRGNTVMFSVAYGNHGASDDATQDIVHAIRNLHLEHGSLQVGGEAAELADTLRTVGHYLPYAGAIIVLAMFVLLSLMVRSVIIPLQAIVINSFSLSAAFGVLVWVFQEGHFTTQTWLTQTGGLDPTIPILIFAVAFGLSMDYSAFLYSRMREEYDVSHNPNDAILKSIEHTGGIITAAALLLFVVVAAFASSKIAFIQQVGIGLSLAVLLDAFVIRILFVPAVMRFFGHASWYAPKWLSRWEIKHG